MELVQFGNGATGGAVAAGAYQRRKAQEEKELIKADQMSREQQSMIFLSPPMVQYPIPSSTSVFPLTHSFNNTNVVLKAASEPTSGAWPIITAIGDFLNKPLGGAILGDVVTRGVDSVLKKEELKVLSHEDRLLQARH
jgi:hypothetical protein